MNPLFASNVSNSNNFMQNIKNMMNTFNAMGNPQQALQQLANANPNVKQILQMANGGSLEQLFMSMCQQQGVDPNTILNQLR